MCRVGYKCDTSSYRRIGVGLLGGAGAVALTLHDNDDNSDDDEEEVEVDHVSSLEEG